MMLENLGNFYNEKKITWLDVISCECGEGWLRGCCGGDGRMCELCKMIRQNKTPLVKFHLAIFLLKKSHAI